VSFPLTWDELDDVRPGDFTIHTALAMLSGRDRWTELMPEPNLLSEELVAEGRLIPIARVQALHEGKRRARAQRQGGPTDGERRS
jgi:DNA primase